MIMNNEQVRIRFVLRIITSLLHDNSICVHLFVPKDGVFSFNGLCYFVYLDSELTLEQ
jgi:hypothetical protein